MIRLLEYKTSLVVASPDHAAARRANRPPIRIHLPDTSLPRRWRCDSCVLVLFWLAAPYDFQPARFECGKQGRRLLAVCRGRLIAADDFART